MKQHTFKPHPSPMDIPHSYNPERCTTCGMDKYPIKLRVDGEYIYYNLYWGNNRYLGENLPECVNWEEENFKRID